MAASVMLEPRCHRSLVSCPEASCFCQKAATHSPSRAPRCPRCRACRQCQPDTHVAYARERGSSGEGRVASGDSPLRRGEGRRPFLLSSGRGEFALRPAEHVGGLKIVGCRRRDQLDMGGWHNCAPHDWTIHRAFDSLAAVHCWRSVFGRLQAGCEAWVAQEKVPLERHGGKRDYLQACARETLCTAQQCPTSNSPSTAVPPPLSDLPPVPPSSPQIVFVSDLHGAQGLLDRYRHRAVRGEGSLVSLRLCVVARSGARAESSPQLPAWRAPAPTPLLPPRRRFPRRTSSAAAATC